MIFDGVGVGWGEEGWIGRGMGNVWGWGRHGEEEAGGGEMNHILRI